MGKIAGKYDQNGYLVPLVKLVVAFGACIFSDRKPKKKFFNEEPPVHPVIRRALAFGTGMHPFVNFS